MNKTEISCHTTKESIIPRHLAIGRVSCKKLHHEVSTFLGVTTPTGELFQEARAGRGKKESINHPIITHHLLLAVFSRWIFVPAPKRTLAFASIILFCQIVVRDQHLQVSGLSKAEAMSETLNCLGMEGGPTGRNARPISGGLTLCLASWSSKIKSLTSCFRPFAPSTFCSCIIPCVLLLIDPFDTTHY